MSARTLTTIGRAVMAEALLQRTFVAALSSGEPVWDAAWDTPTPPVPPLAATSVQNLIGYVRPTILDFVESDEEGTIQTLEGGNYSLSNVRTRYARIRISIPQGAFGDVTIREIGIFANPTIADGVPTGQTVLSASEVTNAGDLTQLSWDRPQFLNAGTSLARNFILKV